jgi:hypothetical protein
MPMSHSRPAGRLSPLTAAVGPFRGAHAKFRSAHSSSAQNPQIRSPRIGRELDCWSRARMRAYFSAVFIGAERVAIVVIFVVARPSLMDCLHKVGGGGSQSVQLGTRHRLQPNNWCGDCDAVSAARAREAVGPGRAKSVSRRCEWSAFRRRAASTPPASILTRLTSTPIPQD